MLSVVVMMAPLDRSFGFLRRVCRVGLCVFRVLVLPTKYLLPFALFGAKPERAVVVFNVLEDTGANVASEPTECMYVAYHPAMRTVVSYCSVRIINNYHTLIINNHSQPTVAYRRLQ
jgi:hypothetical protein